MSEFIIRGHDIAPYFSPNLSDTGKEIVYRRAQSVAYAIGNQQPIGIEYSGNKRIVDPHALFLRERIPTTTTKVKKSVMGIITTMNFDKA